MVAATPSGGWIGSSPVIAGLGFPLGTRGQMFYLNPQRPNALQPRKRPRATLTPTIVTRDGDPFLAFGTPGGDGQDQWTLQFFLNYVEFGLDLQQALDTPTVHTTHFPSSFYPRNAYPGRVEAESRLPEGDAGRTTPPRSRPEAERRLESRQAAGDPLPRRPRPDPRRRNRQEQHRLRHGLVTRPTIPPPWTIEDRYSVPLRSRTATRGRLTPPCSHLTFFSEGWYEEMAKVRIAVSVEQALAQRADEVARRWGTPRSRLYARALEEFLTRAENRTLLEDLNEAFADFPDEEESATLKGMRALQRSSADPWR